MRNGMWILLVFLLCPRWGGATVAGSSYVETRFFTIQQPNTEYLPNDRRPTFQERVAEVTGHWRFFLQAYRAVASHPALASQLVQQRPFIEGTYDHHQKLYEAFAALGVSQREIDTQPTAVYTLQLYAFRDDQHVRRFLRGLPFNPDGLYSQGTAIYSKTSKDFRLAYGDESLLFKGDPVYLTHDGRFTRVRYGIYAEPGDARHDAVEWKNRYHVEALAVRVPFRDSLVQAVIWGELPGVFSR